jgi:hypothetical protein
MLIHGEILVLNYSNKGGGKKSVADFKFYVVRIMHFGMKLYNAQRNA